MLLKIRRFFSRTKSIAHTAAISFESKLHTPTVMLSAPSAIRGKAYWASFELNLLLYRRQRLKAIWKLKCFNFNPNWKLLVDVVRKREIVMCKNRYIAILYIHVLINKTYVSCTPHIVSLTFQFFTFHDYHEYAC
jgi:hypothetical protein